MKGERLSWKEQWVLSEVIWSAFDFSEPSEHFPAIIYLLYASTFNTPDAPREMWGDLFMWKWCHVMFEMKAVCKGNDSLVSVCQTSKQYMKGRDGCLTLFTSPNATKETPKAEEEKRREHQKTCIFPQKALVVEIEMSSSFLLLYISLFFFSIWAQSFTVSQYGFGLVVD